MFLGRIFTFMHHINVQVHSCMMQSYLFQTRDFYEWESIYITMGHQSDSNQNLWKKWVYVFLQFLSVVTFFLIYLLYGCTTYYTCNTYFIFAECTQRKKRTIALSKEPAVSYPTTFSSRFIEIIEIFIHFWSI